MGLARRLRRIAPALGAVCVFACGPARPDRTAAPGYAGDDEGSGHEEPVKAADLDDDEQINALFPQLAGADRIKTCAPRSVAWVILTYAPELLDAHQVRTREIHCVERAISEKCSFVADVRYFLDDPNQYFAVQGVKPERALRIAELSSDLGKRGQLRGVAVDKKGVYLVTLGDCGTETQLAVRLKGAAASQRLELIETRYSVEL